MKTLFYALLVGWALICGQIAAAGTPVIDSTQQDVIREFSGDDTTCTVYLAQYEAQYPAPQYTCSCPNASGKPVCTLVCPTLLASYQAQYGPNYTCSCPSGFATPYCPHNPPYLWTLAFVGQNDVYQYPAMYWSAINFNPGGVISFIDVSGEGYGTSGPAGPSTSNGTVIGSGAGWGGFMEIYPLYSSIASFNAMEIPTGYAANINGQSECMQPHIYGGGVNPTITCGTSDNCTTCTSCTLIPPTNPTPATCTSYGTDANGVCLINSCQQAAYNTGGGGG